MSRVVPLFVVVVLASQSFGQIVYEPVKYQHGSDEKYFYGGNDSLTHRFAARELHQRSYTNRGVFSGSDRTAHELFNPRAAVYTDEVPLTEASQFGFTENDARNEANANAPLYFRKLELLAVAQRDIDGSLVVPANSRIVGKMFIRDVQPTTAPATTRGAVIIIPKRLLDKPLKPSDKQVAIAR
jgi:hypothetical protein